MLVSVDGRLRELHKILSNDCTIEFITIAEKIGMETYRRSATFLLVKAVHDVIGAGGKRIKEIGSRARNDIERLLSKHVYLELKVKVDEDWRNEPKSLANYGYKYEK